MQSTLKLTKTDRPATKTTQVRLLPRDLPFHQSKNKLPITNTTDASSFDLFMKIIKRDWFHYLLRQPTTLTTFTLLSLWVIVIFIFAGIYMALDRSTGLEVNCGLGPPDEPIPWGSAFAFSLETCTTVGYGLPGDSNAFFENNCPSVQGMIAIQMMLSMMFNAFLFAFFFARISRSETRGSQVLFGDKAIVKKDVKTGRWVLEVRCYDADSGHPIVEAHVRLYCIRHNKENMMTRHHCDMNLEVMRIVSPNDDLGAVLFTSAPASIVHDIDSHSPIFPPKVSSSLCQQQEQQDCCAFETDTTITPYQSTKFGMNTGHLVLRDIDSMAGDRDGLHCVICGESYGSMERLVRHVKYQKLVETNDDYPVKGSHQELDVESMFGADTSRIDSTEDENNDTMLNRVMVERSDVPTTRSSIEHFENDILQDMEVGTTNETMSMPSERCEHSEMFDAIRQHMMGGNIEILCVVEGIDPLLSGTFQSLQSYTADDIVFGGNFAPCVIQQDDGKNGEISAKVDLDRFHDIVEEE